MSVCTVQAKALRQSLKSVAGGLTKKGTPLSILENVLVRKIGNSLKLITTDLEFMATASVPCEGDIEAFTTPYRKLYDIARLAEDNAEIRFKLNRNGQNNEKLSVSAGSGRYSLSVLPASQFPEFDCRSPSQSFRINEAILNLGFDRVSPAIAENDVRICLNGCLLESDGKTLSFVGSNGHRLAYQMVHAPGLGSFQVILPRRGVTEMQRLLGSDDVDVTLSANAIGFSFAASEFWMRPLDATYLNWRRHVNYQLDSAFTVSSASIAKMVDRLMITGDQKSKGIEIAVKDGVMRAVQGDGREEAEDTLEVEGSGAGFFRASGRYLLDAVSVIKDRPIKVILPESQTRNPLVIGFDDDNGIYRHIVAAMG